MPKHVNAIEASATNTTAAPVDPAPTAALHWSISDAWDWLGHTWISFIHVPYLGLLTLVIVGVVVLRALGKLLK